LLRNAIYNCLGLLCKGRWSLLGYVLNVKWHGLDFEYAGVNELGLNPERSRAHEESIGPALNRVLRTLRISATDAALDIGCGKGAAMLTMANYPFARVDGLDISERLIQVAGENLRRMRARNSALFQADAAEFGEYSRYTFFYLYNPFPPVVMVETMARISKSLKERPRKVTRVYMNPKDRQIVEGAGFRKVAEFDGKAGEYAPVIVYQAGAETSED
jgi:SAM-dependent methyltransferase